MILVRAKEGNGSDMICIAPGELNGMVATRVLVIIANI